MDETDAQSWYTRWELQQDGIVSGRAERFGVMLETLTVLFGTDAPLVVLDLASGPGGLARRVLEAFPKARGVAVELDPVLLAIGRGAHGDLDGRLEWVEHDLRDPGWADAVREAIDEPYLDAVLTSTALHWLPTGQLVDLYRQCGDLLRPGGVLLNADNMDDSFAAPTVRRLSETVRAGMDGRHAAQGAAGHFETWEAWWEAVSVTPELAELHRERERVFAWRDRTEYRPGLAVHRASLQEAGFREVETVWQQYQNRVLMAVR